MNQIKIRSPLYFQGKKTEKNFSLSPQLVSEISLIVTLKNAGFLSSLSDLHFMVGPCS